MDVPSGRIQEVQRMKFPKMAVVGAVMVMSNARATEKNLIFNGGFEEGPAQPDCAWVLYEAGNPSITGWRIAQGNVDRERMTAGCPLDTEVWRSFEGEFTIDMTGTVNGTLCQSVTLSTGSRYRLEFALSGNCTAPRVMPLEVRVGGIVRSFEYFCAPEAIQPWIMQSFEFIASVPELEICFVSNSPYYSVGAVIDAICLVAAPTCPADVIENGVVDGADLSAVLSVWGTDGGLYPRADTNGDGIVDGQDLATVLGGWGPCGG
jgi:hypothetical protein